MKPMVIMTDEANALAEDETEGEGEPWRLRAEEGGNKKRVDGREVCTEYSLERSAHTVFRKLLAYSARMGAVSGSLSIRPLDSGRECLPHAPHLPASHLPA